MKRWMILPLLVAACGDPSQTKEPVPVPAPPDGKTDAGWRAAHEGNLAASHPDGSVFTSDLEFHGWTFDVYEPGEVRLDITRTGTRRGLDTTLFVFGPLDGTRFGTEAAAFDDDGGWGRLSRIQASLQGGRYLAVVGTADGRGRGQYQIELTCQGATCDPAQPDPGCPPRMHEWIADCVRDVRPDVDGDATAWFVCADQLFFDDFSRDDLCGLDLYQPRPAWCDGEFDARRDECADDWEELIVAPAMTIAPRDPGELLEKVERLGEQVCACSQTVRVWRYEAALEPIGRQAVVAVLRAEQEQARGWRILPSGDPDQLAAELDALPVPDFAGGAMARADSDVFHVGRAHRRREALWVLAFPETGFLVSLRTRTP